MNITNTLSWGDSNWVFKCWGIGLFSDSLKTASDAVILDWINWTDIFPEKNKQNTRHPSGNAATEAVFTDSLPVIPSHGDVPALININPPFLFPNHICFAKCLCLPCMTSAWGSNKEMSAEADVCLKGLLLSPQSFYHALWMYGMCPYGFLFSILPMYSVET